MFTGLCQLGQVMQIQREGAEARLRLRPSAVFKALELGESIAVNGACLTVEELDQSSFTAYASGESLSRTNLGALVAGMRVNLERAMRLSDRLGGHLVSGHVDCITQVLSAVRAGKSMLYRLAMPPAYTRQVLEKGSVTLDGISLTVNARGDDFFEVNIIPATLAATTAVEWKVGQEVNFESDLLGKYVERMLGQTIAPREDKPAAGQGGLTLDFLREHGF